MRRLSWSLFSSAIVAHGPVLIGVGLAVLVVAMIFPGVPAVGAMAIVALGATGVTLERYRAAAGLVPMLLAHLMVYSGLYAIFVGATLDLAAADGASGLTIAQALDLAISVLLMAATWRIACRAMAGQAAGEP